MIVGALTVSNVHAMDTTADAGCMVDGCYGMALRRVEMAGYPAGYVCTKHGIEWVKLWREITEPEEPEKIAA